MNLKHYLSSFLVLASASVFAVAAQQGGTPGAAPAKKPAAPKRTVQPQDHGERLFQQHCSRCHAAPEGFPPSITGTIVRHMRVRAGLSQHDEEALLHFFSP
jgi:mono/diheme cytochrome c family protein